MSEEIINSITSVKNILTQQVTPSSIAFIIVYVLGAAIILFLTWFGVKKLITVIKNALHGKLSLSE